MSRCFFLLLIIVFVVACGKNSKPDNILPKVKMERVIWDMVQADEFVQTFVLKDSNKVNVNAERYKLYEQVFQLHNTNKDQFKKSYEYYASRPAESKALFDSLSAKASRRMQDVYKNVQ